jgi:hypothetical protein
VSDRPAPDRGKLSPQTLIVASLASLTAAIVTSIFWQTGTPITAAITPVIVALASELYSRPARRITELGSRGASTRTRRERGQGVPRERTRVGGPPRRLPEAPPPGDPALGPMRVYRSEPAFAGRRRLHIKLALVTAAIAFLIAAVVLTVPELVFGGSVASHGKTTFFGGQSHKRDGSNRKTPTTPSSTAPSQTPSKTTTQPPAQTVPQATTPTTPPPQSTTSPGRAVPKGTTGPSG